MNIKKLFRALEVVLFEVILVGYGFVLINTEIGSEIEVIEKLREVEEVEEAYITYGVYDVVAKVGADTMEKLKEIVTWKVRRLDKVRSTLTMIIIEEEK